MSRAPAIPNARGSRSINPSATRRLPATPATQGHRPRPTAASSWRAGCSNSSRSAATRCSASSRDSAGGSSRTSRTRLTAASSDFEMTVAGGSPGPSCSRKVRASVAVRHVLAAKATSGATSLSPSGASGRPASCSAISFALGPALWGGTLGRHRYCSAAALSSLAVSASVSLPGGGGALSGNFGASRSISARRVSSRVSSRSASTLSHAWTRAFAPWAQSRAAISSFSRLVRSLWRLLPVSRASRASAARSIARWRGLVEFRRPRPISSLAYSRSVRRASTAVAAPPAEAAARWSSSLSAEASSPFFSLFWRSLWMSPWPMTSVDGMTWRFRPRNREPSILPL